MFDTETFPRREGDIKPWPLAPEASALTTELPRFLDDFMTRNAYLQTTDLLSLTQVACKVL